MLQKGIKTQEIGMTEYTDSKQRRHRVKHSVISSESDRRELEEETAEELYRIFMA